MLIIKTAEFDGLKLKELFHKRADIKRELEIKQDDKLEADIVAINERIAILEPIERDKKALAKTNKDIKKWFNMSRGRTMPIEYITTKAAQIKNTLSFYDDKRLSLWQLKFKYGQKINSTTWEFAKDVNPYIIKKGTKITKINLENK